LNKNSDLHPETIRAIDVPFVAPNDGAIEIGSIAETVSLALPSGEYLLRCEFLAPDDSPVQRVRLTFTSEEAARFFIVLADAALSDHGELLTTAEPASG
jgi:hypothetical protein